ncbi:MAG TPA: hypothetical protein VKY73_24050 [Polyangiaceae bacterium]|nr:hypothetical protein [Polyangiaceae bacterium]
MASRRLRRASTPSSRAVADDTPYSVHCADTELRSARERAVWLAMGADDSMKLWLNGELVFTSEAHLKPWVLAEGFVPATLRAGHNSVLVRLENAPEGSAFSVLVRTAP